MITEPGGMSLADAIDVIKSDYILNEPSSALIYAARRALLELRAIQSQTPVPWSCRSAEDRGDGKAQGAIPCAYHAENGPPL